MNPVGYLRKEPGRYVGERGAFYDYVLAGNGVFVEAEGELLAARTHAGLPVSVRGLEKLEPKIVLRHGLVPPDIWSEAVSYLMQDTETESYIAVVRRLDGSGYTLLHPAQAGDGSNLIYSVPECPVLVELHTHVGTAFFSPTDNLDEQGLKIYGVLGMQGHDGPEILLRVGVYGYRHIIPWSAVFSGQMSGITDKSEVKHEMENLALQAAGLSRRRMWWDRWFRGRRALPASG